MEYPDGEVVDFNYNPTGLEGLEGDSVYAMDMEYDEAGRMTRIVRGNNLLTSSYTYFDWDETSGSVGQSGRLESLTTITSTGTLQDLAYQRCRGQYHQHR
jgi:hypothetical protein